MDTCPRCYDHECQKGRTEGRRGREEKREKERERKVNGERGRAQGPREVETQKKKESSTKMEGWPGKRRGGAENTDEHSSPMEFFSFLFLSFFFSYESIGTILLSIRSTIVCTITPRGRYTYVTDRWNNREKKEKNLIKKKKKK